MIVASIHDPALMLKAGEGGEDRIALLVERLRRAQRNHLWIQDQGGVMGRALLAGMKTGAVPAALHPLIQPSESRVIRLVGDEALRLRVEEKLGQPDSAVAASLLGEAAVDVMLAHEYTDYALAECGTRDARVTTLGNYWRGPWNAAENMADGAIPVDSMPRAEFVEHILAPILKWSRNIWLLDRYICEACLSDKEERWDPFKRTIRDLYRLWRKSRCAKEPGARFEIISFCCPVEVSTMTPPIQAERLFKECDFHIEDARVRLKRPRSDEWGLAHDRYLRSNLDFTVGFSSGFDLLLKRGICADCDVYLRQRAQADKVAALINHRNEHCFPPEEN